MSFAVRLALRFLCLILIFSSVNSRVNADEGLTIPSSTEVAFTNPVEISLVSEDVTIEPGRPFWVAVQIKIDDHWHAYWKNPGGPGMPPSISWNLPEGFQAGPIIWPTPKRFDAASTSGIGYENDLFLLTQIFPPPTSSESSATLSADVRWIVCSDTSCLPGDGPVSLHLPIKIEEPKKSDATAQLFEQARSQVPKKTDVVKATRRNDLLEVAFNDEFYEKRQVHSADFFPEETKTIDPAAPNFKMPSPDSKVHTLLMKELAAKSSLKGVLVLHTSKGIESYDIDTPIALSEKHSPLVHHESDAFDGMAIALLFAFIGGMILNLMPCVLPVISFKILGFVKLSGQSRGLIFRHGVAFSAGVLLSFWILAFLLLILQAYGRSVGWGFQLQEPLFVAILAALLFIFGLNLFGLFEIGTSLMAAAGEAEQKANIRNQLLSSFFSGILATALATPCTGPFLGSAVGFAFTVPPFQAMLIFTAIGLGMSFPYLALAAFPSFLRFIPKPGPWMETFKELMGFIMMASVVWLIWVFGAQTSSLSVSLLIAGFFTFALGCWIYGRWATPTCKKSVRLTGTLATILMFSMATYLLVISTSSWAESMGGMAGSNPHTSEVADAWEEFSPERVEELRSQGIPVFVDFTAKWCLVCQVNHLVLLGDDVAEKFKAQNVVRMKADWTKRDDIIAGELRKYGRNSVPLYLLYDGNPDTSPSILPQVLTPNIVIEFLDELKPNLPSMNGSEK